MLLYGFIAKLPRADKYRERTPSCLILGKYLANNSVTAPVPAQLLDASPENTDNPQPVVAVGSAKKIISPASFFVQDLAYFLAV